MFSHFLLVPHFSAFFQFNLGFAREHIGVLYLCGGLASLAAVRLGGSWIDRGHARRLVLSSSGLLALITLLGFALLVPLPLLLVFSLFMALSTLRTSSTTTVAASIPAPHQRAAFMALHGSVSNVCRRPRQPGLRRLPGYSCRWRADGFRTPRRFPRGPHPDRRRNPAVTARRPTTPWTPANTYNHKQGLNLQPHA